MRSYQIIEWGQPLEHRETPTPEPAGTEVLLRITAAGICHSDLHIWDGYFDLGDGKRLELGKVGAGLPLTLGHEIAGVVEAVGPDAEGVAVGVRRVAFPWIGCQACAVCEHEREQWCMRPQFLGARVHGGYSDYVLVPHPRYLIDHEGVPSELACTYACAGLTAYSALRKAGDLRADDHLLLIGAGGVGLSALHMARCVTPARVLVADVDARKRGVARQAGASETIDNGQPDAVARVMEATGGGARAAIDFVGAPATSRFGMDVLRRGGTLVIVGLFGGTFSAPLPFFPQRSLNVRGSYVGTLEEMEEVMALGRAGKVPPIPLDVRPLDAAPQALDDLRAGRVAGRVILKPDAG
jgi:D-arabinose 1-dehydrogenase-like Zn-dependent alcohol dehydrogenase